MTQEMRTHMGLRLHNVRKQRGITSVNLAQMTSLSRTHISNIERAVSEVSLNALIAIVEVLDVSLDYIVFGRRPNGDWRGLVLRSDDELTQIYINTEIREFPWEDIPEE